MKKAVIFDLDGTLWDSSGVVYLIWNRVFERHKDIAFRATPEYVSSTMGITLEEMGEMILPDRSKEFQKQIVKEITDEEVVYLKEHGGILFEGVEGVLEELYKNYQLMIVSNCQDGYVDSFLDAHHLRKYFSDYETNGKTGLKKGENTRLVINRNNIDKAVFVGDTEGDEKAAREAGIPFIHAAYGFGKVYAPDEVITTINQLPEVIDRMFK